MRKAKYKTFCTIRNYDLNEINKMYDEYGAEHCDFKSNIKTKKKNGKTQYYFELKNLV